MKRKQQIGEVGEKIALQHLQEQGYLVLAQNWRTTNGEVDLVAQDGETIVFVEVKTRTTRDFGWPEESITRTKRRRLHRAAWAYLDHQGQLDALWRFDVIAIELSPSGSVKRLEHYINAIEGDLDLT